MSNMRTYTLAPNRRKTTFYFMCYSSDKKSKILNNSVMYVENKNKRDPVINQQGSKCLEGAFIFYSQ